MKAELFKTEEVKKAIELVNRMEDRSLQFKIEDRQYCITGIVTGRKIEFWVYAENMEIFSLLNGNTIRFTCGINIDGVCAFSGDEIERSLANQLCKEIEGRIRNNNNRQVAYNFLMSI